MGLVKITHSYTVETSTMLPEQCRLFFGPSDPKFPTLPWNPLKTEEPELQPGGHEQAP
jgi:hypothetical protein